MPAGLHNMAKMTVSGAPGAGTVTLLAAVPGYLTFAQAGVVDQETVSYVIEDLNGTVRENGRGVYSSAGPTLTRGPRSSTNGGAAVSAASTAVVFIDTLTEDMAAVTAFQHANCGGLT